MTWSHRWSIGKHGRVVQYLTLLQAGRATFKLVINSQAPPRKASGYKGKTPINFPWNTCWRNSVFNRNSSWSSLKLSLHRIPAGRGFVRCVLVCVCNVGYVHMLHLLSEECLESHPGSSHESRKSLQVLGRRWRIHSFPFLLMSTASPALMPGPSSNHGQRWWMSAESIRVRVRWKDVQKRQTNPKYSTSRVAQHSK